MAEILRFESIEVLSCCDLTTEWSERKNVRRQSGGAETRLAICEGACVVQQLVALQKVSLVQHRSAEPIVVAIQAPHETCRNSRTHAITFALRFGEGMEEGALLAHSRLMHCSAVD